MSNSPQNMPLNNGNNIYSRNWQERSRLLKSCYNLDSRLNEVNDKIKLLNEMRESMTSRLQSFGGLSVDKQLMTNWQNILLEIRRAQKERNDLQTEREDLEKKEQRLQATGKLAFLQYQKGRNNATRDLSNPWDIELA